MNQYEKVLYDIVSGIVAEKETLSVKQLESLDNRNILIHVYANEQDIARLIGKKGNTATAIRHLMQVAFSQDRKRFNIRFEAY